ncbi:MAG: hypothetical protein CMH31_03315 [Micavibrio sp.]|nr:hypothetical protein [Micavibrio sp.]|tara:strand:+ start:808 stop:1110 length:303 start_codon:yes stop_codon:yes gene_type:complete
MEVTISDEQNDERILTRVITTPDGTEHIIKLPESHWFCLDYLIQEGFTDLETQIEIVWNAWIKYRHLQPEISLEHAFAFGIQEANVQYEYSLNGFSNDNA